MKKSVSTLVAALCVAFASSLALAQSSAGTTKGGSDYERSMQQAGMSGMSGMSGTPGTTVAPSDKPAKKGTKSSSKSKKKSKKSTKKPAAQ